jgi:acetyl-CoA synthetase
MGLLRRTDKREPEVAAGVPFDPAWGVPTRFDATRDVVDAASGTAAGTTTTALVHVSADGTIDHCTSVDVARESMRWARLLAASVVEPGTRVTIALEPGTAWAGAILGAMRIGALPVPIGSLLDADALHARLAAVEPALLLHDMRTASAAAEAIARLSHPVERMQLEETVMQLVRPGSPTEPLDPDAVDPALILFTRGRGSGGPRPVVHAHAATYAARGPLRDWLAVERDDLVWCDAGGGSGTAALLGLFGPWQLGAGVLFVDRDVRDHALPGILERFAPTVLLASAERLERIVRTGSEHGSLLPRLRSAGTTDDWVDADLAARFRAQTGIAIANALSTTETGVLTCQAHPDEEPVGTVGAPLPGMIVAPVDGDGRVVGDGQIGEIAVYGRPPSLCLGYWEGGLPDESPGGDWWTLTDDKASFDQDGRLWLDVAERPGHTPPEGAAGPLRRVADDTGAHLHGGPAQRSAAQGSSPDTSTAA